MLAKNPRPPREQLAVSPIDVLRRLPSVGKLMVAANNAGVTHERIGPVETIDAGGSWAVVSGKTHDSQIDLAAIAAIIVDRTSVMRDKVYPRIELHRADGTHLCHFVGFDGLEAFDDAISFLGEGQPLEAVASPEPRERRDVSDADAALVRLDAERDSASRLVVSFQQPGFVQRWTGVIEEVRAAMGFVNIIRPDFHLHIRAGAINGWDESGHALGINAELLPLVIEFDGT